MSALEQAPYETADRRRAPRLRIEGSIAVLIGRGEGVLIDLSANGARVRHAAIVRRGSTVRLSFEWASERIGGNAEVLASHVVSLGGAGTTYESRLRFTRFDAGAREVLARALDALENRGVRRLIANLRGWTDEVRQVRPAVPSLVTGSYIRCRLMGARWEVKAIGDGQQPDDGFALPAPVEKGEILRLCDDYARAGEDGRRVIRLLAAAAVEETGTAR